MPVPGERDAVQRHLLRDTAYEALCEAIVSGTLLPGERLHDSDLCGWLGLSRTPVRDALGRLQDEGLVESAPQRFTRVTPLHAADARHAFPVLASLHALATELAVPNLGRDDHRRLVDRNDQYIAALTRGDAATAYDADDSFHALFVSGAANPELERTLSRVTPRFKRLERLREGTLPGRRSIAQHQAIMGRALAGDAVGAGSAARENWLELGALVARDLERASTRG